MGKTNKAAPRRAVTRDTEALAFELAIDALDRLGDDRDAIVALIKQVALLGRDRLVRS